jgi:hypothetical protein
VDPAPPQITIVNPNDPTGTTDLLISGSEGQSWRPSSRAVRRVALGLLALAVVGISTRAVLRDVLDRRADARAVAEVDLAFADFAPPTGSFEGDDVYPVTTVALVSRGAHPIDLTDVAFPGLPSVPVQAGRVGRDPYYLPLPDQRSCDLATLSHPPSQLQLTLTTYRGTRLTRTLPLRAADLAGYAYTERLRCGFPSPAQATFADIEHSEVDGRTLVLHYQLGNDSRTPIDVVGLRPSPGLTVSTSETLPLRLAARTGDRATRREVVLRVRVSDCDAYRTYVRGQEHLEPSVELVLKDRFAQEALQVGLNSTNDGILPTEVYAAEQLLAWCTPPTRSG